MRAVTPAMLPRRSRGPILAAAVLALGVSGLLGVPQIAHACSAARTGGYTASTVCAVDTPAPKKTSTKVASSDGGRRNPVVNYRMPSGKEFSKAMKRAYNDADQLDDYKAVAANLDISAMNRAGICVGGAGYRWSGSGYAATSDCAVGTRLGGARGPAVIQITPEQAARSVIARLDFTAAAPGIGPDHGDNHLADDQSGAPFDIPVGYPIWLYADGGTIEPRTVTESAGGMSVRISIKVDKISWSLGDGHSKTCGVGTKWRKGAVEPATPSPTCGYVYERKGKYTVTATTHWTIDWAAGGQTGTIPFAIGRDRLYRVGELQTIIR